MLVCPHDTGWNHYFLCSLSLIVNVIVHFVYIWHVSEQFLESPAVACIVHGFFILHLHCSSYICSNKLRQNLFFLSVLSAAGGIRVDHPRVSNGMSGSWNYRCFSFLALPFLQVLVNTKLKFAFLFNGNKFLSRLSFTREHYMSDFINENFIISMGIIHHLSFYFSFSEHKI